MHHSQIPEKPLHSSVNTDPKIVRAEKVYFFERSDGSVIAASGPEAWGLYARKNQIVGYESSKCRLVGTGDGLIFRQAIVEAQKITDVALAKERIVKGQADELEACRGKIIPPPNFDKMGPGASFI